MAKRIQYGFGMEYLSNWSVKEGLREIYQNFMDFGHYEENIFNEGDITKVQLINDWMPKSLDFLRIGNSKKADPINSVGKHGEGLKMGLLVFLRAGYSISLYTDKYRITPVINEDEELGPCFALDYEAHGIENQKLMIEFECPKEIFDQFHSNIVQKEDIVFSQHYGDIVNKPKGSVYSGGLFVLSSSNLSNAYNIKPEFLPLDRDRAAPRTFDINYATSKILEAYGKWTTKDMSYSDMEYVTSIPEHIKNEITPRIIGNNIEFTTKNEEGLDMVIKNSSVINAIKQDNFYQSAIKKLKRFIAKKLGLYDLLLEFKEKHVHSSDAMADFDVILERVSATEEQLTT